MKSMLIAVLLILMHCSPGICQVEQRRPELCGLPGGSVAPPRGFSAIIDATGAVKFSFRNGAAVLGAPDAIRAIEEVCPLPGGRLAIFGETGGPDAVYILEESTPALVDSFGAYGPLMSPDQRWIAFRKAYPPHGMELPVSEEYLLYDLSRGPALNRGIGVPLTDGRDVGAPVYPLGQKNLPFDAAGLPAGQLHRVGSDFFWSPDSKALIFVDELLGKPTLVLVAIDGSGATQTSVYPLDEPAACTSAYPVLRHAEFGPDQDGDRVIFLDFAAECLPQRMQVRSVDFKQARPETHTRPPSRKAIRVDQ